MFEGENFIYNAKVPRLDNFDADKYSGAHEGPFNTRVYGHRTNMKNRHQKGTGLSKHIWKLKGNQPHPIPYEVEWSILAHAKPFDPVTGVCRLCPLEAYYITFDPENVMFDIARTCKYESTSLNILRLDTLRQNMNMLKTQA